MLSIIVPVFDLGGSYGNVRSGKSPENVWKRSWSLENLFSKLRRNPVDRFVGSHLSIFGRIALSVATPFNVTLSLAGSQEIRIVLNCRKNYSGCQVATRSPDATCHVHQLFGCDFLSAVPLVTCFTRSDERTLKRRTRSCELQRHQLSLSRNLFAAMPIRPSVRASVLLDCVSTLLRVACSWIL